MALTLNFEDDYLIWDNPEKVVYSQTRRGDPLNLRVSHAIRHRTKVTQAGPSNGVLLNKAVFWYLPSKLLAIPGNVLIAAKPGDRIVLESNQESAAWFVTDVGYEELDGVYELTCLEMSLADDGGLADRIDVVCPLNRQDAKLGRKILWTPKRADVPCKIFEVSSATVDQDGRRSTKKSYLIYVVRPDSPLDVTEEDQVRDRRTGDIYDVVGYTNPETINEPQIIQAERVP